MKYIATIEDHDHVVDVDRPGEVLIDGQAHRVNLRSIDGVHLYSLIVDDCSFELHVERHHGVYYVQIGGDRYAVDVEQERLKRLRALGGQRHEEHGGATVPAPMPGLVVKLLVSEGEAVEANQGLVILEAMKMENEIRSPRAGVVEGIAVAPGAAVNKGDALMAVTEPQAVASTGSAPDGA